MKRPWERDRRLAHIPLGWRQVASHVLAMAGEHCLASGVAVRWSAKPHAFCPALIIIDSPNTQPRPDDRDTIQCLGRARMDRIALRAVAVCMSCGGVTTPPAHVALQVSGSVYVALLCADCEDGALLDGHDFWAVIGRFDPLVLETGDLEEPWLDGADDRDDDGEYGDDRHHGE
jgi:hypothetical protein